MASDKKKRNIILTVSLILVIIVISTVLITIVLQEQYKNKDSSTTVSADLSADEVVNGVIKKMNYTNLSPISKESISCYYQLPEDAVSDYAMYISGKSGDEVEITCFVLTNEAAEDKVTDSISEHLNTRSSASEQSNTSSSIQPITTIRFPYVFVTVAQDSETAAKAFETIVGGTANLESSS